MEVVCMLNAMYTKFDQLSERHGVYKVGQTRTIQHSTLLDLFNFLGLITEQILNT
jgi:hypothetical protein